MSDPINAKIEHDGKFEWSIEIGGHPITDEVASLTYEVEPNSTPKVTLNLGMPVVIHHHGLAQVALDEDTTAALKAMGWVSPTGAAEFRAMMGAAMERRTEVHIDGTQVRADEQRAINRAINRAAATAPRSMH